MFGSVGMRLAQAGDAEASRLGLAALALLDADRTAGGLPGATRSMSRRAGASIRQGARTWWSRRSRCRVCSRARRPTSGAAQLRARAVTRGPVGARRALGRAGGFFAYHPTADVNIHNANLLGALCVHLGLGDDASARDRVRRAIDAPSAAQAPDGGFPYGDGPGLEWRDSFHTGFVLRCLMEMDSLDPAIDDAVRRGAASYLRFFDGEAGQALG